MRRVLMGAIVAVLATLGAYTIARAQAIPIELRILDPECTVDVIDTGNGPETVYNCPTPSPTPTVTPVVPDPEKPIEPLPDIGAPDTGYYRESLAVDTVLVGVPAGIWLLFLLRRKKRHEETKPRKRTARKPAAKKPTAKVSRKRSVKKS